MVRSISRLARRAIRGRRGVALAAVAGLGAVTAVTAPVLAGTESQPTAIQVRADESVAPVSPALLGTNHRTDKNANGMWDPEKRQVVPEVVEKSHRAGLGVVRFPGGTIANMYDWKASIGPPEERECQVSGRHGGDGPFSSDYGLDEHMAYVEEIGAEAEIMTPVVGSTPAEAADWVEYMNTPVGENPNGGVAWAKRRAANGHPEPYDVAWWELGNEHDRLVERYWMSAEDNELALRQYAFGGVQRQVGQPVGTQCDHRDRASLSDATAGQTFKVHFEPVVPGSQTVYVDGVAWTEVDDLATAGPDDTVYEFEPATGEIVFGDGTHGAIPPAQAPVTADYDSGPHGGFVDFYRAMKEVDPDIDVCATWAPVTEKTGLGGRTFPEVMAAKGHGDEYDCATIHPYTNFKRDFGADGQHPWQTAVEGHDQHFVGEVWARGMIRDLEKQVKRYGRDDAYVTISEFGALWGPRRTNEAFPEWNTSMSHALYMASHWAYLANHGAPWSVGNALIGANSPRTVIGPAPDFVFTSEAVVREAMEPLVAPGATVVENEVLHNPVRQSADGDYPVLAVTASRSADGALTLMVVNRHPSDALATQVSLTGHAAGTGTVTTVNAESFTSYNSSEHPNAVAAEEGSVVVDGGAFGYTFPAHSVTLITLHGSAEMGA